MKRSTACFAAGQSLSIGGPQYLVQAISFVDDVRPTFLFAGYSSTDASTSAWTSSDRDGTPLAGGGSYSYPWFAASLWVAAGGAPDQSSQYRGPGSGARAPTTSRRR